MTLDNRVLVVGATNFIDRMDPAAIRPGRFDKKIFVPPPDFEARKSLFRIGLSSRPHAADIDFADLGKLSDGFTCANIIEDVVESAARAAANMNLPGISQEAPRTGDKEDPTAKAGARTEKKNNDQDYIR